MSILGLPSFETGINLPVSNGLYPKPARTELSNDDEAIVVSSNGGDWRSEPEKEQRNEKDVPVTQSAEIVNDIAPDHEKAAPEVPSVTEDQNQLEPIVEAPAIEALETEAPVEEDIKETITPQKSPEPAPTLSPVPENAVLEEPNSLPAESPVVNDSANHGNPGDSAAALSAAAPETVEAERPQIEQAALNEGAEAEHEHHADHTEADSDPAGSVTSPVHSISQAPHPKGMALDTLPPISEASVESEESEHSLEEAAEPEPESEPEANDLTTASSGPAGLGPLGVIKEEAPGNEEPITAAHEGSNVGNADVNGHKPITNEVLDTNGLTSAGKNPKNVEEAAASGETAADDTNPHDGDAAFNGGEEEEGAAADDTTPVNERRGFLGVTGAVDPDEDRKDSMFETPFETPMEKRAIATEDSTPFETSYETPMERPFWASSEAAAQHDEPEQLSEDDEPAEPPFIPRHSPDRETATGDVPQEGWETVHKVEGFHGTEEHVAPSAGTTSVAESATNEPLLSDEQLDVSDEFKPGVQIPSVESAS